MHANSTEPMRIALCITDEQPDGLDARLIGLQTALPNAHISIWQPGERACVDYALVWRPSAAMLASCEGLKAIFNLGAGVDAILQLGASVPANVPIIRVDDAGMGLQMVHYVAHAVLRYFRRFDHYDAARQAAQWQPLPANRPDQFPIGILGLGVLGSKIAAALLQLGFPVHGWRRTRCDVDGIKCYTGQSDLPAFLAASRVVVCVLPLTAETTGILNHSTLSAMPRGSYLINVARGAHVVDDDLLALIDSGHIAGATLDVVNQEPLPSEHPYWRHSQITITPHIAAQTLVTESMQQIADKIKRLEQGQPVTGIVDWVRGY
jgi:glyoxylate/hydroxypyruvate reductase A